ncbi:hypothetical protein ABFS83_04G048300 [Erythranthe nasuta]
MNGIHHNSKNSNLEKKYAGCLGRMVNLFELNTEVPANRLLQDKPHADGSSLSRSRSDVSRMSLSGDSAEEKVTVSEFKSSSSNRKSNGTPMKMLIAQEMSKEIESRRDPPNLVAKLMGLDALPRQEPDSAIQRRHSRGHPRSHSEIPLSYWEQQNGFFHYVDPKEYKDVHGILQQSQKPPHKGIYEETVIDKKMALVRQKFTEAKRLSMDEKLRQSKQFQDALEVLSSNKDLFLECLQEPDSFFSEHLYGRESLPPPRETRRITVLRPSKMADDTDISRPEKINGKEMKKGSLFQLNGLDKIHPRNSPPASSPEPTRIVVLKPTTHGKPHAVGSLLSELPKILHSEEFFGDVEDEENRQSREVAKAITQQIHEKLDGNFSDSEVMSPVSRHSWDYVNRLGSPYSSSSFTRASYSPESSVCREAKKRLSERWALMASNGICQEQKPVRRSSSTLGEMLALSETNNASPEEEGSSSKEPMDLNSFLVSESREEGNVDYSPRNLTRSKSVPVSSIKIENRLNDSVADKEKPESPKEDVKARSVKLSFTGKVSSLFFSRNKKTGKDKSLLFGTKDEFHSGPGEIHCDRSESLGDKGSDHASSGLLEPSSNSSSSNLIGELGTISPETGFAAAKPIASGNPGENQEQPSPISVLDSPFGEDEHTEKLFRHCIKPVQHGVDPPHNSIGSNLIDKSPLIGSIARTLSWDDSCINTATSHPTEESLTTTHDETNENQEWSFFFKTLLSVSGLQFEMQSTSFLAKWHSPESPLDPSLRDKYVDLKNENKLHEAKQMQGRSIQRLVFDCVNSALIEITGYGSDSGQKLVGDEVWTLMNAWFSEDVDDCGDDTCLMVERVVRKEVVGKGWNRHFRLEMDNLGKEIEGKLLEELVQEALVEFDR